MLGSPCAAAAQVRAADLQQALGELKIVLQTLPPVPALPRLRVAVDWLDRRAGNTDPSQVSEDYVRSLRQAASLLRRSWNPELIDDVTSELEAKVDHCRMLGIGMGGSVVLNVTTRRGAEAVGAWQVLYLLKIYEHVQDAAPVVFPTLSSPTEAALDPGRYWLWARDPATGRTSGRALVRVIGGAHLRVDLPVP